MQSRPSTIAAVTASSAPRRVCHEVTCCGRLFERDRVWHDSEAKEVDSEAKEVDSEAKEVDSEAKEVDSEASRGVHQASLSRRRRGGLVRQRVVGADI
jgi:hypothetical protein